MQIRTADDIKQLGSILSIWAHPDDESRTSAGLLVTAIENGQKVVCVTATRGELGVQDETRWPASQLADIRTRELDQALKILGIKQHYWLGYKDGNCDKVNPAEAKQKLAAIIEEHKPDTIITFGPDGFTGHPDHICVSQWATMAAAEYSSITVYHAAFLREQYEKYFKFENEKLHVLMDIEKLHLIDRADCAVCLELPNQTIDKKYRALQAASSQYDSLFKEFDEKFLRGSFGLEAFVRAA